MGRAFVDSWGDQYPDKSMMVIEDQKSWHVTYWGDKGSKFRVKVHQKPNQIGFHARLPGDKKAK